MKTYCRDCKNVTEHRKKELIEQVFLCNTCDSTNMPIALIKANGETHYGSQCKFVEWEGEDLGSRARKFHDEPQVGYSIVIDPQYVQFTWLTTPITQILQIGAGISYSFYKFKTNNSEYSLYISKG
jgi:hypothetical protein